MNGEIGDRENKENVEESRYLNPRGDANLSQDRMVKYKHNLDILTIYSKTNKR